MEFFYRDMRRKTGLLMEGDKPAGGQWNFDHDNRKPAKPDLFRPRRPRFAPDAVTEEVLTLVEARFAKHFRQAAGPFAGPPTGARRLSRWITSSRRRCPVSVTSRMRCWRASRRCRMH